MASSRRMLAATGAAVLGVATWLILTLYTSPEVRECQRGYRHARTAADTAQVDIMVPGKRSGRSVEARACGVMRYAARWH